MEWIGRTIRQEVVLLNTLRLRVKNIYEFATRNNRKNTILHDSDKLYYYLASTKSQLVMFIATLFHVFHEKYIMR